LLSGPAFVKAGTVLGVLHRHNTQHQHNIPKNTCFRLHTR